jgi:ABC-type uncharacterized transport system permease subunit
MTSGRGLIAAALGDLPPRETENSDLGALLFGGNISSARICRSISRHTFPVFQHVPYIATIIVLILAAAASVKSIPRSRPACVFPTSGKEDSEFECKGAFNK